MQCLLRYLLQIWFAGHLHCLLHGSLSLWRWRLSSSCTIMLIRHGSQVGLRCFSSLFFSEHSSSADVVLPELLLVMVLRAAGDKFLHGSNPTYHNCGGVTWTGSSNDSQTEGECLLLYSLTSHQRLTMTSNVHTPLDLGTLAHLHAHSRTPPPLSLKSRGIITSYRSPASLNMCR